MDELLPPYIPPPPPISSGASRRGIIPYGSFDPITLKEAAAIVADTSEYYQFAEDGSLQRIGPKNRSLDHALRRDKHRALLESFTQCEGRQKERQHLLQVKENGAALQSALETEIAELSARIDAHQATAIDYDALLNTEIVQAVIKEEPLFALHPDAISSFERHRAIVALHADPNSRWSMLYAEREARTATPEWQQFLADEQMRRTKQEELNGLEHELKTVAAWESYDQIKAQFQKLQGKERLGFEESHKCKALYEQLQRAVALFEEPRAVAERMFLWDVKHSDPYALEGGKAFTMTVEQHGLLNDTYDDEKEALRAVVCILANAALKQDADAPLAELIRVNMRANDRGETGRASERYSEHVREEVGDFPLHDEESEAMIQEDNFKFLERALRQYHALEMGATRPAMDWREEWMWEREDVAGYEYERKTLWDPIRLRNEIRSLGKALRYADPESRRNEYPEATAYLEAMGDMEVLDHLDGRSQQATDIKRSMNNPWTVMQAGGLQIAVDSPLLAFARQMIDLYPFTAPSQGMQK